MDIIKDFQEAIEIEYKKNLEDFEEQNKLPLDERVAKGVTMTNLRIEFEFYDGLPNQWCYPLSGAEKYISSVKIFCDNNISKFKEGNSVVLSHGSYSFEMDIDEDLPFIDWQERNPSQAELSTLRLDLNNDLFAPFFQAVKWKKGGSF